MGFKEMSKLLVFYLGIAWFGSTISWCSEIFSVIVLYRHGDRAPIKSYKYDVYDESYWPDGFGQLTNIGKIQQYELGKWFRKRYDGFLPKKYHRRDIRVLSSNKDRCLMSAAANLAGLYPPEDSQIWDRKLMWQPIPIHTMPEVDDALLIQRKPCPKYNKLHNELLNTKLFQDTLKENFELFQYLSVNTGEDISDFEDVKTLYDTLYIEDLYNLTLPIWTQDIIPKLENLTNFSWNMHTYTMELAVLKTGPLIDYIATHLENIVHCIEDTPKFLMLSAHDTTLVHLLNTLKIFDYRWPPYASAVIFELRKDQEQIFVNMLYKNSTEPTKLILPNCDFDCGFDRFIQIIQPFRISLQEWQEKCSK